MSGYVTNTDPWGIMEHIFDIAKTAWRVPFDGLYDYRLITQKDIFLIIFNQHIPTPYRASTDAVRRHRYEIKAIVEAFFSSSPLCVWIKRPKQDLKTAILTIDIIRQWKHNLVEFCTYDDIENAKMRWQSNPAYDPSLGFSRPIKEEVISFKLVGGE